MSSYVVMKKKGMPNKEYIKLLQEHLNKLSQENNTLKQHVNNIIDKENVLPKEIYDKLLDRYFKAVNKLKNYNLWTGE